MSAEDKRDIEITRKDLYCQRPEISMDWKYKLQFLITFKKKENVWNTRQFIRLLLCYYLLIWYNCKIRPPTLLFSSVDNNVPPCKVVSSNRVIWKADPFILLLLIYNTAVCCVFCVVCVGSVVLCLLCWVCSVVLYLLCFVCCVVSVVFCLICCVY